ncbi:MAG: zinc-ribbon domain-containing protein [Gemmatirosa sp.]
MNVTCPECRSIFRVDPVKVPASGVRARCSVCGGIFPVAVEHRAQAVAPGGRRTPAVPTGATPTPAAAAPRVPTPAVAASAVPALGVPTPAASMPTGSAPEEAPTPARAEAAAPAEPPRDASIWGSPASVPAQRFGVPGGAESSPTPMPASAPPVETSATSLTPQGVPVVPPPDAPAAPAVPAASESAPRRPVNPYLSNDPNQKARRLARALVSDLIAYHPQKREEGLRAGTLKQLFRDEIRKSWEEYVEQVGAPVAESTPHFQDALNDLLAGGRKVF